MGMSAGSSKEINVTPLIDVLLVLLIIFMVSLPIMLRMQQVEVPPKSPPEAVPVVEPVVLKINADMTVTIDEAETVAWTDLPARVGERVNRSQQVFVDFGDGVPWSDVLHTVDVLRGINDGTHVAVRVREDSQVGQ